MTWREKAEAACHQRTEGWLHWGGTASAPCGAVVQALTPRNKSSWPKEQTSGKTKQCLWVKEVALGGEKIVSVFFFKACITPVKRKHFKNSLGPKGVQRCGICGLEPG